MIRIRTFKEKEKEGGEGRPQLGGFWKVILLKLSFFVIDL